MKVTFEPIGYIRTSATDVPRHWSVSEVEGEIEIDPAYILGLKNIQPGQEIVVIFHFHKSGEFHPELLMQTPPHRPGEEIGVFSICSPRRPNPIGLSIYKVLSVEGNIIRVKGLDAFDGTPVLDIKPHVTREP